MSRRNDRRTAKDIGTTETIVWEEDFFAFSLILNKQNRGRAKDEEQDIL